MFDDNSRVRELSKSSESSLKTLCRGLTAPASPCPNPVPTRCEHQQLEVSDLNLVTGWTPLAGQLCSGFSAGLAPALCPFLCECNLTEIGL